MAIEVGVEKAAGVAVFKLSGPLSVEAICSAIDELVAHPDFTPGMNISAVLSENSADCLAAADVRAAACCAVSKEASPRRARSAGR